MFKNGVIVALRKIKGQFPYYLVKQVVLVVGYLYMLSAFYTLFDSEIAWMEMLTAIIIFVLMSINITQSKVSRGFKEIGLRKLLGAPISNIYFLALLDTAISSLITSVLALVVIDVLVKNELLGITDLYSLPFVISIPLSTIAMILSYSIYPLLRYSKLTIVRSLRY